MTWSPRQHLDIQWPFFITTDFFQRRWYEVFQNLRVFVTAMFHLQGSLEGLFVITPLPPQHAKKRLQASYNCLWRRFDTWYVMKFWINWWRYNAYILSLFRQTWKKKNTRVTRSPYFSRKKHKCCLNWQNGRAWECILTTKENACLKFWKVLPLCTMKGDRFLRICLVRTKWGPMRVLF